MTDTQSAKHAAGREANRPREIPRAGWKHIALRVKDETGSDRLTLVAAGVAFYAFLALFPALAAIISVWGLFADPAEVQRQLASLEGVLPSAALQMLEGAATRIAASSPTSLGWGVAISLGLTLWSANKGMKGLLDAVNLAYDQGEDRGFLAKNAISLALTLGAVVVTVLAIAMVVAVPAALAAIGLGGITHWAISLGRWPILAALIIGAIAVIYRVGPNREDARWRWVTPGSVIATVLWLGASVLFSIYVANFGTFNETYGSVAAVAIMLMWFYLSAFMVLLGAEINAETEKQTARDTTTGPERPLGERDAVPADTVADRPAMH